MPELNQKCDQCGADPIRLRLIPGTGLQQHFVCVGCDDSKKPDFFTWEIDGTAEAAQALSGVITVGRRIRHR